MALGVGAITLVKPVQYGVEVGIGGMEVYLIAAPAESSPANHTLVPSEKVPEKIRVLEPLGKEATLQPIVEAVVENAERKGEKTSELAVVSEFQGDGTSWEQGQDPTTWHSIGGAEIFAQPNYFRNPAPSYPQEARQKGQEGRVVLLVRVSKAGRPVDVTVDKGSGFPLLDQSAIKAVWDWKFYPAQVGPLPVDSRVQIPIRFRLED